MLNLPLSLRFSLAPLLLILTCIALYLAEPISSSWLAYERIDIQQGELWRLISGNVLHTNLNHLMLNCAAVVLLWALHGQYFRFMHYCSVLILLCLITTTLLYCLSPQLLNYVGLSGVLHGLFVIGAYYDIKNNLRSGWLLLVGVLGKIIYEQWFGASPEVAALINANVAIDAHLFGGISGLMVIFILYLRANVSQRH